MQFQAPPYFSVSEPINIHRSSEHFYGFEERSFFHFRPPVPTTRKNVTNVVQFGVECTYREWFHWNDGFLLLFWYNLSDMYYTHFSSSESTLWNLHWYLTNLSSQSAEFLVFMINSDNKEVIYKLTAVITIFLLDFYYKWIFMGDWFFSLSSCLIALQNMIVWWKEVIKLPFYLFSSLLTSLCIKFKILCFRMNLCNIEKDFRKIWSFMGYFCLLMIHGWV